MAKIQEAGRVRKTLLLFCFVLLLAIPDMALAGGWTQKYGAGLYIQNISYYRSSHYFDSAGKKQKLLGNYNKYDVNPYFEYGARDWLTLGANLSLQKLEQKVTSGSVAQVNYGVGDSEFFARTRLWHGNGFSFAAEPMIKIPSLRSAAATPQIGSKNYDAGLTISGGYCLKAFELYHFANVDLGYRKRFGQPKDQAKLAATIGISLSPRVVLMPQAFVTSRLGTPRNATLTQSSGDDYNLSELRLSVVYKFDEKLAVQVGGFRNVAGKNVGSGNGVLLSLQKSF